MKQQATNLAVVPSQVAGHPSCPAAGPCPAGGPCPAADRASSARRTLPRHQGGQRFACAWVLRPCCTLEQRTRTLSHGRRGIPWAPRPGIICPGPGPPTPPTGPARPAGADPTMPGGTPRPAGRPRPAPPAADAARPRFSWRGQRGSHALLVSLHNQQLEARHPPQRKYGAACATELQTAAGAAGRTAIGGGPSTESDTTFSPRMSTRSSARFSSRSSEPLPLPFIRRNSSASDSTRFMCLSKARNLPTSMLRQTANVDNLSLQGEGGLRLENTASEMRVCQKGPRCRFCLPVPQARQKGGHELPWLRIKAMPHRPSLIVTRIR